MARCRSLLSLEDDLEIKPIALFHFVEDDDDRTTFTTPPEKLVFGILTRSVR
jgi:hypothetical protein